MRYISANRVFDGSGFLKNDSVIVLNEKNEFVEFSTISEVDSSRIEKFNGTITPGFINAHCHLELSHLQHAIPQKTGLVEFAKNIINKRSSFSEQEMNAAMESTDLFMKNAGIVAVGDISNTHLSFKTKQKSSIYYHTFIELIGLDPKKNHAIFNLGITLLNDLQNRTLNGSFAAHAPYSTSNELIQLIIDFNLKNNAPFSIHNQESEEENKFLQGKKSEFQELFESLKLDISWFKPEYKSSLHSYASKLKGQKNILVHNTYTGIKDLQSIGPNTFLCLCPTANIYIENALPDYDQILKHTQQICFGTDSLASNSELDVLKEASIFYNKTKNLELSLKALTSIAAEALGLQNNFGRFIKNKDTGLNIIDVSNNTFSLIKVIS